MNYRLVVQLSVIGHATFHVRTALSSVADVIVFLCYCPLLFLYPSPIQAMEVPRNIFDQLGGSIVSGMSIPVN